jgi:hypothetical protein
MMLAAEEMNVVPAGNKRMQRTRVADKFVLRSGHRRVADARRLGTRMSRYVASAVAGISLVAGPVLGQPAANTFVHYEQVRIAFYEAAPRAMARSMRGAVSQRCRIQATAEPNASLWYCSGDSLLFLRGVNILGDRYRTGFACDESAMPEFRFYTEDMFVGDEIQCVFIAYDVKSKLHMVDAQ